MQNQCSLSLGRVQNVGYMNGTKHRDFLYLRNLFERLCIPTAGCSGLMGATVRGSGLVAYDPGRGLAQRDQRHHASLQGEPGMHLVPSSVKWCRAHVRRVCPCASVLAEVYGRMRMTCARAPGAPGAEARRTFLVRMCVPCSFVGHVGISRKGDVTALP